MSEVTQTDLRSKATAPTEGREDEGVLRKLPRTRPQRASPRRAAARAASAREKPARAERQASPRAARAPAARGSAAETRAASGPEARGSAARPKASAPKARTSAAKQPNSRRRAAAPRQGFEIDGDTGNSVQPPGGAELFASAAEIVGELTKAGLSRSERLLKGFISRLPLS
jgi:hypothetical protein